MAESKVESKVVKDGKEGKEETKIPSEICGLPVIRQIDQGSWATIYEVEYKGKRKALKLSTNREMEKEEERGVEELTELTILNQVCHPNLLYAEGFLFQNRCTQGMGLILPLMTGGTFHKVPTEWTWMQRRRLFYQVASALAALHHNKILHLDVTSRNVLYQIGSDGEPEAYLGDFGLAVYVDDVSVPVVMQYIKTAEDFRAIEQHIYDSNVNKNLIINKIPGHCGASDIWSLAQTATTLFGGQPLFHEDYGLPWLLKWLAPGAQIRHSIKTWLTVNCDDDSLFIDLVSQMFAFDPRDRPTIDEVLRHEFFKGIQSIPSSVTKIPAIVPRSSSDEFKYVAILYKKFAIYLMLQHKEPIPVRVLFLAIDLLYRAPDDCIKKSIDTAAITAFYTSLIFYSDYKGTIGKTPIAAFLFNLKLAIPDKSIMFPTIPDLINTQALLLQSTLGQVYRPTLFNLLDKPRDHYMAIQIAINRPDLYAFLVNTAWPVIPDLKPLFSLLDMSLSTHLNDVIDLKSLIAHL